MSSPNNIVLGPGVSFVGTMTVPGKAVIEGGFSGELNAGEIEVGLTGHLKGTISANSLDVRGLIEEKLSCKNICLVRSTGVVSGVLEYGELQIERGGVIKGSLSSI